MTLEHQILCALVLDLLVGDPGWLPHPVRAIGFVAARFGRITRRVIPRERIAGITTALSVVSLAGLSACLVIIAAEAWHPWAGDAVSVVLIYTTVALRDLTAHSGAVSRALEEGDLVEARRRVGMLVSRDTCSLDRSGVVRAAVESVAENIVDGVTGPILFGVLAGPTGAIVYRAANTLDSMFGYRTERYRAFGWASARLDDLLNLLPARLTAPFICLAAGILHRRATDAARIVLRDARAHASPNAGFAEAAVAGALGVQLGGPSRYFGEMHPKPTLGDPQVPLAAQHIEKANRLAYVSTGLLLAACLSLRCVFTWAL